MENVILSAVFWTITYILLIIHSKKYRKHGIPLTALCFNFAWETVALFQCIINGEFFTAFYADLAWFIFDLIMVLMFYFYETGNQSNVEQKVRFAISFVCSIVTFAVLTKCGQLLLSSYVIALIMAVLFIYSVLFDKVVKNVLTYSIGVCKLIADLFAWLAYRHLPGIDELGMMALVCNSIYIVLLIGKTSEEPAYYELIRKDGN